MQIRVAAPAKLNLYLHVVGKRDDGYHLLDSLVAFAADGDVVTASPAPSLTLAIDGPFADGLSNGADNLVHRAATALASALGRAPNVALTLTKNLPVASGIGGGSADAAAALRALCEIWSVVPSDARVEAIAAKLGADVPVCLRGEAAYLVGIGHETDPAPALPAAGLLLVNPRVSLPTPPVFKARTGPFSAPARFERAPRDVAELGAMLAERRNDLTAGRDFACTGDPRHSDRAGPDRRRAAGAHVGQRRHLLCAVRRSGGSFACRQGAGSVLVDFVHQPRLAPAGAVRVSSRPVLKT